MISKIIILYLLSAHTVAEARVFYTDDSNAIKSDLINYDDINNYEQSSRDLDLSFSTGDTASDNNYPREYSPLFKRVKQVRPYGIPERQYSEITKEIDHPRTYYKLIEVPERRPRFEEMMFEPKRNAKLTQSTAGDRQGEVILELRVITKNDAM